MDRDVRKLWIATAAMTAFFAAPCAMSPVGAQTTEAAQTTKSTQASGAAIDGGRAPAKRPTSAATVQPAAAVQPAVGTGQTTTQVMQVVGKQLGNQRLSSAAGNSAAAPRLARGGFFGSLFGRGKSGSSDKDSGFVPTPPGQLQGGSDEVNWDGIPYHTVDRNGTTANRGRVMAKPRPAGMPTPPADIPATSRSSGYGRATSTPQALRQVPSPAPSARGDVSSARGNAPIVRNNAGSIQSPASPSTSSLSGSSRRSRRRIVEGTAPAKTNGLPPKTSVTRSTPKADYTGVPDLVPRVARRELKPAPKSVATAPGKSNKSAVDSNTDNSNIATKRRAAPETKVAGAPAAKTTQDGKPTEIAAKKSPTPMVANATSPAPSRSPSGSTSGKPTASSLAAGDTRPSVRRQEKSQSIPSTQSTASTQSSLSTQPASSTPTALPTTTTPKTATASTVPSPPANRIVPPTAGIAASPQTPIASASPSQIAAGSMGHSTLSAPRAFSAPASVGASPSTTALQPSTAGRNQFVDDPFASRVARSAPAAVPPATQHSVATQNPTAKQNPAAKPFTAVNQSPVDGPVAGLTQTAKLDPPAEPAGPSLPPLKFPAVDASGIGNTPATVAATPIGSGLLDAATTAISADSVTGDDKTPEPVGSLPAKADSDSQKSFSTKPGDQSVVGQLPGLRVVTYGPESLMIRQTGRYAIRVENRGAIEAEGLIIRSTIPDWAELRGENATLGDVSRRETDEGGFVVWTIDSLPAGKSETLNLSLTAGKSGTFQWDVDWRLQNQRQVATVQVKEPRLKLSIDGPDSIVYGESETYTMRIVNPGDGLAAGVSFILSPDSTPQTQAIGDIPPGKEAQFDVELCAQDLKDLTIKGLAVGDLDLRTEAERSIRVLYADLQAELSGPEAKYQNAEAKYGLVIQNNGTAASENVVAKLRLPAGIEYLGGMDAVKIQDQVMQWQVPTIAPGDRVTFQWNCRMKRTGDQRFEFDARGTAAGQTAVALSTRVESIADLVMTISDPPAPAPVGTEVAYEITIRNRGSRAAKDVKTLAQFSNGIEPKRLIGHTGSVVTGQVLFDTIDAIKPGEEVKLKVIAVAETAGHHRFRTEVTSDKILLVSEEATHYMNANGQRISRRSESSQR